MKILIKRLFLVVLLVGASSGCKQASQDQRANDLAREANQLGKQSTELIRQWADEYQKTFTTENGAKFPGNRDWMRAQAEKIIAILDESSSVDRRTAAKFEEAGQLYSKDGDRRAATLIATSLRRNIEVNELIKAQVRLVSDETIKDEKTLTEKMKQSWQVIRQKQLESEKEFGEGKRLLGN